MLAWRRCRCFFIVGGAILASVDERKGIEAARVDEPGIKWYFGIAPVYPNVELLHTPLW